MVIKEINKVHNWFYPWTEDLKASLREARNNRSLGELLVYEDSSIRVWSTHLEPQQSLLFHKHALPYVYIAQSNGSSRSFYGDGKVLETKYKQGDVKCFPDLTEENSFVHNLENTGKTLLIFTTIEFKQ